MENLIIRGPAKQAWAVGEVRSRLGARPTTEHDVRQGRGRMFLTDTLLGGVSPEEATVDLGPFDLDMLGSLASGRVRGAGPLSGPLQRWSKWLSQWTITAML